MAAAIKPLSLQLEVIENITAPAAARDFVEGFAVGLGMVAAGAAIVAFT